MEKQLGLIALIIALVCGLALLGLGSGPAFVTGLVTLIGAVLFAKLRR